MRSKLREIRKAITDGDITREEVLLELFIDEDGDLYLSELDFSEFKRNVYIHNMKVGWNLIQNHQEVGGHLFQNSQKVGGVLIQNSQKVGGDYYSGNSYIEGEIYEKKNYKSHKLKIDKQYLDALLEGTKTFEIRYNDRNYKVGDYLLFENKHKFKITYITDYEQKEGYVVMSVERVE